jgi:NO-binding membrane sensor protein with MHYT domain
MVFTPTRLVPVPPPVKVTVGNVVYEPPAVTFSVLVPTLAARVALVVPPGAVTVGTAV